MANRFNVNEAYPGFCSLCHDEIAEFDGFIPFGNTMRPKVIRLKANFRQATVKLSDSNYMNISLCDKCINFKPEDCEKLYDSELRGWEREIREVEWKSESKPLVDALFEKQKSTSIVDRHDIKWSDKDKEKITKKEAK